MLLSSRKLTRYFLDHHAPAVIRDADRQLTELRQQRRTFFENLPTVMVMQEMEQPRETHVLIRGQYDRPGAKVEPGVPAAFPAMPANSLESPRFSRAGLSARIIR